jgi:hypothetical protein
VIHHHPTLVLMISLVLKLPIGGSLLESAKLVGHFSKAQAGHFS